jgi:hypothetical protein
LSAGQIVIVSDELDQELQDTLIGPLPAVSIIPTGSCSSMTP